MNLQFKTRQLAAFVSAGLLALAGCSGEDGSAGAPGANGTSCSVTDNGNGTSTVACTDGTTATVANGVNGQSCTLTSNPDGTRTVTCPDGGTVVLPAVAVAGDVDVTDQAVAIDGADVVVTFKVKVDGVDSSAFTVKGEDFYRHGFDATVGAGAGGLVRTSIAPDAFTVTASASGYTLRLPGMATTIGTTPTTFFFDLVAGPTSPVATVVAHSPAGPSKATTPSDQACINCHGDNVFRGGHHDANIEGIGGCVVCHVRYNSSESRLGTAGSATAAGTAPGTRLMGYVHGIHNSHNMAAGRVVTQTITYTPVGTTTPVTETATANLPAGTYARNGGSFQRVQVNGENQGFARDAGGNFILTNTFSIGFPSYMNNCSTCHDNDASLANVLSKPVSFQTCMSCHDGWYGFGVANTGTPAAPIYLLGGMNHANYNASTNCGQCHGGGVASSSTVGDFHGKRQVYTPRNGLLYDGKDQSIEQGKRVAMKIDGVTRDETDPLAPKYVVTWSATFDGVAVDPCNTDVATGPVFLGATANAATGQSASNMSLLLAYAQGNDWVSAGIGTAPGQPVATNLAVTGTVNTTCASNVATSTIAAPATTATKGVLALQGKPQVTFTSGAYTRVIQVRSPSPTREFVVATGAAPAAADARRPIVDTAKCLTCHQGSLYQHGGNRVDNVDLCVMCHNPASNEKNNRVNMAVDTTEAYDKKAGETYDLRYMLHAVHSAGATNAPLVYYRTNGLYVFGSQAAIDALPNWPGAGCFDVFGSTRSQSASGAGSTGSQCDGSATAEGTPSKKNHNEIVVHYPRALNDCAACHTASDVTLPSTLSAVAVTIDAGGTSYGDQTDDVLLSPATASCMGCHQSGDVAMQLALRSHAFQNSWTPAAFTNGRADILGGSAGESCVLCHGAGSTADFNAAHSRPAGAAAH